MTSHSKLSKTSLIGVALAAACTLATAQTSTAPQGANMQGRNGASSVPSGMPPGATSTKGDKAAAPNGNMATDPATGSTPGMPPGAMSENGDKAATPKGKGQGHMKKSHDKAASGTGM